MKVAPDALCVQNTSETSSFKDPFFKSLVCVMSVVEVVGFLQCCPPHPHLLQRVGFVLLGQRQLAFIRSLCAQDGFTASKDVDK